MSKVHIDESYREQAVALAQALGKFRERNSLRHDLFLEHGALEALRNVRAKADRARSAILSGHAEMLPEAEIEDDLIDLVNYAVFALRCVRQGQIGPVED